MALLSVEIIDILACELSNIISSSPAQKTFFNQYAVTVRFGSEADREEQRKTIHHRI